MTRRQQKHIDDGTVPELNMTPMIDVVFQLLIFFMCSIHFRTQEGKLQTFLPKDVGPRDGDWIVSGEVRVRMLLK